MDAAQSLTRLEHAITYARRGWPVFPCQQGGKPPLTTHGVKDATTDEKQIRAWWRRWPEANIGVATGKPSGFIVLDLDVKGTANGIDATQKLYGFDYRDYPHVLTPSGGVHVYFQWRASQGLVRNRTGLGAIAPGVELKGDGGYVLVPPSVLADGKSYTREADGDIPECPDWLLAEIKRDSPPPTPASTPQSELERLDPLEAALMTGVPEGARDDTATRLAGRYLAQGLSPQATLLLLGAWNQRNQPPLEDGALRKVVESIALREGAKPGKAPPIADRAGILKALSARFGVEIDNIERVAGTDPIYRFHSMGETVEIKARDIGSQWAWRRAMIAMTKKVPASIGSKAQPGWDHYLQLMLDAAEEVQPGPEATERGQLREWLRAYLEIYDPAKPDADDPNSPRMIDGHVAIHAATFKRFVVGQFDERVNARMLAQQFGAEKFIQKGVKLSASEEGGTARFRRLWLFPMAYLYRDTE